MSAAVSPSSSTSSLLSSSSSLSNSPETCFVCDCPIVERSQTSEGDNAVFCEGPHQQWAHASCVGVSDEHYYSLSSSREPWFCPSCSEIPQEGAKPEGVKSPPLSATITSSDLSRSPVPLPASKCVPLSTSKGEKSRFREYNYLIISAIKNVERASTARALESRDFHVRGTE